MSTSSGHEVQPISSYAVAISAAEYGEEFFEFTYRMGGTGTCIDKSCGGDPIAFTWDPELVRGIEDNERGPVLEGHAEQIFWDEINDQLGDERVLRYEDFGSEEIHFESGSERELERFVHLTLYSFPSLWKNEREEIDVVLYCATNDGAGAQLDDSCELASDGAIPDEDQTAIEELIGLALRWNNPVGSHLEYNDGARDRASGYFDSPNSLDFTVTRPSYHEMAEARPMLRNILLANDCAAEAERLLKKGG